MPSGNMTRVALPSSWCVAKSLATMENANACAPPEKRQACGVPAPAVPCWAGIPDIDRLLPQSWRNRTQARMRIGSAGNSGDAPRWCNRLN
ncbi:hypothetical protein AXG89_12460 [Burkholderia sp. PAMC 26561]|nr:hypothetical protein AXG89_12460 [Burkholderia sp. PAMC 26561]